MEKSLLMSHDSVDMIEDEDWVFKPQVLIDSYQKSGGSLLNNAQLWQHVIDCVQDGISVLDSNYNIISVNATMKCWYEKKLPMLSKKCYSVFHDRRSRCENCPVVESLNQKCVSCKEVSYSICGIEIGKQKVYSVPIIDNNGDLHGVIEYVRDISLVERIKFELHEMKEKMSIIENKNDILLKMMQQKDIEKNQHEEIMKYSIEKIIIPSLQVVKKSSQSSSSAEHIEFIESLIKQMENPQMNVMSAKFVNFTSRELDVADKVKEGKSTKKIAEELFISTKAVEFHRRNVRKKLGLVKNDEYNGNLRAYLLAHC